VRWLAVSELVHSRSNEDATRAAETAKLFAQVWSRLGQEFLDERWSAEYNSIKHGLRLKSAGFTLSVGVEDVPGIPAASEKMKTAGGSRYGSSFLIDEVIAGPGVAKRDPNFRGRDCSLAWNVERVAGCIQLIRWSLNNIISTLKIWNGVSPLM
jgi:hypothetical protein